MLDNIKYAFQPIISLKNGEVFGYEALISGYQSLGFSSIAQFFDYYYQKNELFSMDMLLREKAIESFCKLPSCKDIKLFFNIDSRISQMSDYKENMTKILLEKYDLDEKNICFDVTKNAFQNINEIPTLNIYKDNYQIAIDDFGIANEGFKFLYDIQPNFIKIDPFFTKNIQNDRKKQMFLESIISLAHSLQIKTIAKGIETKEEFLTIKSLGCHYAQGYFISKPEIDTEKIKTSYLEKIIKKEKREKKSNYKKYIIIEDFITPNSKVETILDKFKNQTLEYLPVLNENFNPIGYIDYKDIRGYITNQYGISILKNERNKEGNLNFIISPAVIIDINENINNIISIFAKNNHKNLIIITENEKYYGILTPNELINIIYEQKLLEAKDLNPLTSLPGNRLVTNFMKRFIGNKATTVVYFDFNDFKPFNDTYGFRTGDRAIFMFSDILQKNKGSNFIGHIGGDDFFMGFVDKDFEEIYEITNKIVKKFKIEAESLYKEKDIKNGYIISKDREGNKNKFPLLSVSAAILEFELNDIFNEDTISEILGSLKKEAKKSDNNIAIAHKLMI